jgi:DNA repair protein RecN (Recombination protein N)
MTSARWSMPRPTARLLDAFAGLEKDVAALETLWDERRAARCSTSIAPMERAAREADYLRHAVR